MAEDSFVFYLSWVENIKETYPNDIEMQRKLFENLINYGIYNIKDVSIEPMWIRGCFDQIDNQRKKRDQRSKAGRLGGLASKGGGAPQGNKNASQKKQQANASKQQANVNVNVNGNVNGNANDININKVEHGTPLRVPALPSLKDGERFIGEPMQMPNGKWTVMVADEIGREEVRYFD